MATLDPAAIAAREHAPKVLAAVEQLGLQRRAVPHALSAAIGLHMAQVVDPAAWDRFAADIATAALDTARASHRPEAR